METYKLLGKLGCGKYGTVREALDQTTNEVVAIKQLHQEFDSKDECIKLQELQSLLKLNNHPNIVKLKHSIFYNNLFFFIFERMDGNLRKLINQYIIEDKVFSEHEVRNWMLQILQAIEHMHNIGYFHRDLKPENLLVSKNIVKVADLGAAEELSSGPPYASCCVTSGFYSAPEMLLQCPNYGFAIDIWAVGAIMAELFTFHRLFPGAIDLDKMYEIAFVLRAHTKHTWLDGMKMSDSLNIQFHPTKSLTPLALLFQNASAEALDLISAMCSWDPSRRPTASQALQHPFFRNNKQCGRN